MPHDELLARAHARYQELSAMPLDELRARMAAARAAAARAPAGEWSAARLDFAVMADVWEQRRPGRRGAGRLFHRC